MAENTMKKIEEIPQALLNEHAVLRDMIEYKREQLKRLQQEEVTEQSILVEIKRQIVQARHEVKAVEAAERAEFLKAQDLERATMQAERQALERLDLEINARLKDVERLQAEAAPIEAARQHLAEERLAIEQQRVRNEDLRQENDRIANSTASLQEEASQLKASLTAQRDQLHRQAQDQEARGRQLEQQQQDVALQVENLTALKDTLDPKLAELRVLDEKAQAAQHQAQVLYDAAMKQQASLDQQKSDLAVLSSQLQAKADALTEYDAALKHTDAELRIKLQQAKLEGVVMPEAPKSEASTPA